jgi:hypothetical protein
MDDRHVAAQIADVGDDVGGENDDDISPIALSRLWKRTRSSGSRPAVGSSTMMSRGLPSSACAMPKRCFMPPEKLPSALRRWSYRLVCCSRAAPRRAAQLGVLDSLEHGKVGEQFLRRDFGIEPELLRQVAEQLPDCVLLAQDVDVPQPRAAAVGFLQRGQVRISVDLPAPLGPKQSKHA